MDGKCPMTDDELNEIEARQCVGDVPALVAEVRRLRESSPAIDMDGPNRGRWVWVADGPIPADEEVQA